MNNINEITDPLLDSDINIPLFNEDILYINTKEEVKVDVVDSLVADTSQLNYFNYELNKTKDGYIISALDKEKLPSNLILPREYNGKPITNIKYNGFSHCKNIIRVVIPKTVISIDSDYGSSLCGGFSDCDNLSIVEFEEGSSLRYIGSYAFYKCESLESIILPLCLNTISGFAFSSCSKWLQVYIKATIPPKLGNYAFSSPIFYVPTSSISCYKNDFYWRSYSQLIRVLPKHIPISVGYFSFILNPDESYTISAKDKKLLPANLIIPSYYRNLPITVIGSHGFYFCTQITEIHLPEELVIIQERAFFATTNFKELFIPDTVEIIELSALSLPITIYPFGDIKNDSKVERISFGENSKLHYIGIQGIFGHPLMKNFTIPPSVIVLEDGAIGGCSYETINIPASVRTIAGNPFIYCSSLKTITVDENNRFFKSIDGVLFNIYITTLISYPYASENYYFHMPESVYFVYNAIFRFCLNLRCIYMHPETPPSTLYPQSLPYIIPLSLKIYVPDGSLDLYKNLSNWTAMKNLMYPLSIIDGDFAIIDNTLIQYLGNESVVNIPDHITDIRDNAFNLYNILESFSIKNNTNFTVIDDALFSKDCTKLIVYPKGNSKQDYILPESTEIISTFAFERCENLKRIALSNKLTTISDNSFYNTLNLENIETVIAPNNFTFSTTPTVSFGENLSYLGTGWYRVLSKIVIIRFYSLIPPTLRTYFPPSPLKLEPPYLIEYIFVPKESYDEYMALEKLSYKQLVVPTLMP